MNGWPTTPLPRLNIGNVTPGQIWNDEDCGAGAIIPAPESPLGAAASAMLKLIVPGPKSAPAVPGVPFIPLPVTLQAAPAALATSPVLAVAIEQV